MRDTLRPILRKMQLLGIAKEAEIFVQTLRYPIKRKFGQVDRDIVTNYLGHNDIRKLHIGCGTNLIDGWLNSDYFPLSPALLNLDATKPFPLQGGSFDYVFSEHMIEHITYAQGTQMLAESFNVLKEGGVIRVSTPDLKFLIDLYREDLTELQQAYIKWSSEHFIDGVPYHDSTFVINNFVRDWGHVFIYDERTLRKALEMAGFTDITRCELNQSAHEPLRDLEHESRMPPGFLRLETMTLEGTKPVSA